MKKFNVMAILLIVFSIFSCEEDPKDEIKPQQNQQEEYKPANAIGPHYDETNSTKVSWDQLPAKLKNAIPLENTQDKSIPNGRVKYSSYSFLYGPFGGRGGRSFEMLPPDGSQIYAIGINGDGWINRMIVWYIEEDGTIYSNSVGGSGDYYIHYFNRNDPFHHEYDPDDPEYIYYVSGRCGTYLDRLSIYTNVKSFTYGGRGGRPFYAQVPDGFQILGLWGTANVYVNRIGFYVYTL